MYKLDLEKAEEPEINYQYPLHHRKSKGIPEKNLLLLHDYLKAFDSVDHKKLWKILKEMGVPDHITCLLRNLYADQATSVRTTWNNELVQNWERSMLKLYVVTLLT